MIMTGRKIFRVILILEVMTWGIVDLPDLIADNIGGGILGTLLLSSTSLIYFMTKKQKMMNKFELLLAMLILPIALSYVLYGGSLVSKK